MQEILASERGYSSHQDCLILLDEDFKLNDRTFVRSNPSQKGEPNLTTKMFADWVKLEYKQDIYGTVHDKMS